MDIQTLPGVAELPDPFRFFAGSRVRTVADWRRRREELQSVLLALQFGRLPPSPERVTGEELYTGIARLLGSCRLMHYRLTTWPQPFSFLLKILAPPGEGPFPVVITGDGCWEYLTQEIIQAVIDRGYMLAVFNRTEIVPDNARGNETLFRTRYPGDFGALAAWAWGYHRVVDYLLTRADVDAGHIAVTGHSRGGKTALLAGATDERIALTAPNASGCGGSGCYRVVGEGGEKIEDILTAIPYWFTSRFPEFIGKVEYLPFDQHSLKALVAPRALLSTEGLGDAWANPLGTFVSHLATREVYRFLEIEERIGIAYREGGHAQMLTDWETLLDFADVNFFGKTTARDFFRNPFAELPHAFTWRAPERE